MKGRWQMAPHCPSDISHRKVSAISLKGTVVSTNKAKSMAEESLEEHSTFRKKET
jgi:hypothetical protein